MYASGIFNIHITDHLLSSASTNKRSEKDDKHKMLPLEEPQEIIETESPLKVAQASRKQNKHIIKELIQSPEPKKMSSRDFWINQDLDQLVRSVSNQHQKMLKTDKEVPQEE